MAEPFDPYRKWLGIPPKDQPPNHYRLLGIAALESDPDVIENAANRQMAHVRTFKNSRHAALSQKILTELSAAKLCLLTPDHKEAYDSQLRAQLAAAGKLSDSLVLGTVPVGTAVAVPPPAVHPDDRWRTTGDSEAVSPGPPPVPIPMPVGTAVPTVPIIRRGTAAGHRARRERSALPIALTVISLVVLCGAAGVAALVVSGVLQMDSSGFRLKSAVKPAASMHVEKSALAAPAEQASEKPRERRKSQATPFPIGTANGQPDAPPPGARPTGTRDSQATGESAATRAGDRGLAASPDPKPR